MLHERKGIETVTGGDFTVGIGTDGEVVMSAADMNQNLFAEHFRNFDLTADDGASLSLRLVVGIYRLNPAGVGCYCVHV